MIYNLPIFWYGNRNQGFEFPFSNESTTDKLIEFIDTDELKK